MADMNPVKKTERHALGAASAKISTSNSSAASANESAAGFPALPSRQTSSR
jgi:hypothetical protein